MTEGLALSFQADYNALNPVVTLILCYLYPFFGYFLIERDQETLHSCRWALKSGQLSLKIASELDPGPTAEHCRLCSSS